MHLESLTLCETNISPQEPIYSDQTAEVMTKGSWVGEFTKMAKDLYQIAQHHPFSGMIC